MLNSTNALVGVEVSSQTIPDLLLRLADQSEQFSKCVHDITQFDVGDYGHEVSCTLTIQPPPPYSAEQRKELHVLLARLALEIEATLDFWSLHFEPDDDYESEPIALLTAALNEWSLDDDRAALALANQIAHKASPGPFVNSFRLLELVLNKLLARELQAARFDSAVSHEEFLKMIQAISVDFRTKLHKRVEAMPAPPTSVLRALWRLLGKTGGPSHPEVLTELVKLRNANVHDPQRSQTGELLLPWEQPPLEIVAREMLHLIREIVQQPPI